MTQLFNSFSGKLEEFQPLRSGEVGMYTCGPTVYDFAHIGNFRAFIFEDMLRRLLEYKGLRVKHVMNITDVDDKTIIGSSREGKSLGEFTERYTKAFREDLRALNILPPNYPTEPPRATREIPAMIKLIEKLIQKDSAYVSDGSVYYRVASFPAYGKLSKKNLKGNIKGARVDVDEYDKEEGADFVLWKAAKEGEPSWESPWGSGRPGWHIECSAMSIRYLGETFDIHAGGEDLIFPHHENEIAQSEAATGKKFVRHWLHCKHLLVDGEKMSKSKGNFYTLRDLLTKGYDPMAIRYVLLSTHYRASLNFTLEGLDHAKEAIKKIDDCMADTLEITKNILPSQLKDRDQNLDLKKMLDDTLGNIVSHLEDDLNVSASLACLFEAVKAINRFVSERRKGEHQSKVFLYVPLFFMQVDRLFGLKISPDQQPPNEILKLIAARAEIRKNADFTKNRDLQLRSDEMREKLKHTGWLVKDGRPGEPSVLKKIRRIWDSN